MSEENNNITDSDPCPDEQELKSYASGEMASSQVGKNHRISSGILPIM